MDCDDFQKPYKQRFKGVENFLRRIAFNLGNTASQTEVKIISCIPIDVTDLQQKIISLEKQLHEANEQVAVAAAGPAPSNENGNDKPQNIPPNKDKPATVVNSALCGSGFANKSSTVSYFSNKPSDRIRSSQIGTYCEDCSSKIRKSNVSFVFPALSTPDNKHQCKFGMREDCINENGPAVDRYRNIFRTRKRKKSCKSNNKIKTHLVYYAQHTADNPFKITDEPLKYNGVMSNNDEICISYLNNVIRRQYDTNEVVKEFSNTSNFSRPVCRDLVNGHRPISKFESDLDICSCCHDKFRDIDYHMKKVDYDSILTKLHRSVDNTNAYYDSNHYDVIPVKENTNKTIKTNYEQKLESKINVEMKCWPEHLRTKQKCHPVFVNYHTEIPVQRRSNKILQDMQMRTKQSTKSNKRRDKIKASNVQTDSATSKSCCVDCSDVYPKQCPRQSKSSKDENLRTILQKNESIETDEVVNRLQVNNQSTQLDIDKIEDYRELTLNQIKNILQSVLEEVKIGTKLNNTDEVTKKDAVVQKGASQNSMPGDSTFLHSYTYNNSYNTNSYLTSCSKQTPQGQYCMTGLPCQPLKCLQNFPVFIQPATGRHLCACYYKKSSYKPHARQADNRQAMTAGTNTDKEQISSSSETEKLIKEIYKSMAINMDFPTKGSSKSECHGKSSGNSSSNTIEVKNVGISNKIGNKVDAKVSPIQSYANQTKLRYESVSAQSEDTAIHLTNHSDRERLELHSIQSSDTIVEVEKETDESDSDVTMILEEKYKQNIKTKKGFFNRMLKSVNLFKKKKETPTEKDASDSDDYETVYSEKSAIVPPKRYKKVKKPAPYDRPRVKRSPYLEQEYRRQWNEQLAFREQRDSRCSSERPVLAYSNPNRTRPLYWTDFEARTAIVDHKIPSKPRTVDATRHMEQGTSPQNDVKNGGNKERPGWLKKHKLGVNCGEQWKKFILEN